MPGVSIIAAMIENRKQHSIENLRRRSLRDASDPFSYPNTLFINYYRLNKEAFILVLDKIQPFLQRSTIPPVIQLATAIRLLATGAYQGAIGKDVNVNMGRSTVSTILWRIVNAIEDHICPHWIKLEMSSAEIKESKLYFYQKHQIPGVVGCVDGTHVKMFKPPEDESLYCNRKGSFSINAMIICDHKMKVRAVDANRPGSCHDSFIWCLSEARKSFLEKYENGDKNSWLLGDSGYGLEPFLITPYKDVAVGTIEDRFNKKHSSAWNIVERTIAVLKSRFQCLQGTLLYTPEKVIKLINVCCALHNICREYNLELEAEHSLVDISDNHEGVENEHFEDSTQRNFYNAATQVRDNIANQIS